MVVVVLGPVATSKPAGTVVVAIGLVDVDVLVVVVVVIGPVVVVGIVVVVVVVVGLVVVVVVVVVVGIVVVVVVAALSADPFFDAELFAYPERLVETVIVVDTPAERPVTVSGNVEPLAVPADIEPVSAEGVQVKAPS